jgi:hypothetical protein
MLPVSLVAGVAAAALTGPAAVQAATADRWGFAYVANPTVPLWTNLDPAHQAMSPAGPNVQGGKLAAGRFLVRFPTIGLGSRGNVHVTAVNRDGHYCEIVRWYQSGADEIVDVQCFKPGGIRDDSRFTVLWTVSSGIASPPGSYASVQYGTTGVVQSYNSTGAPVVVTPGPVGTYHVRIVGVGVAGQLSGDIQVTAVQPNAMPKRCKVGKFYYAGTDVFVDVYCYDQAGAPVSSEFTASYHRQRTVLASYGPPVYFGYLWTAGGGQTNFNNLFGFGANSLSPGPSVGRSFVKYPGLAINQNHAQVTAFGSGSNYCTLTDLWATFAPDIQVDVICFDNAGNPKPHGFFSTFTNRA